MNPEQEPSPRLRRGAGLRATITTSSMTHADTGEPPASSEPAPEPSKSKRHEPAIDAKLVEVIRRYGDRLSDIERSRLRIILRDNEAKMQIVRRFGLENSDAPAIGLRLIPDDTGSKRK